MIAYLEGQILRSEANLIVLKTSDGVGYAVHVSQHLAVKASPEDLLLCTSIQMSGKTIFPCMAFKN